MTAVNNHFKSTRGVLGLVFLAVLGYALVPSILVRFLFMAAIIWLIVVRNSPTLYEFLFILIATVLFGTNFLLTPVSYYLAGELFPDHSRLAATIGFQVLIIAIGVGWMIANTANSPLRPLTGCKPSAAFTAIWFLLLVALFYPTWNADLAYSGDECYHAVTIQVFWQIVVSWVYGKIPVLIVVASLILTMTYFRLSGRGPIPRSAGTMALLATLLFGVMALISPHLFDDRLLDNDFFIERIARYPAAQGWLSTALGALCFENWLNQAHAFSNGTSRFLPMVFLFVLGMTLAMDRRWSDVSALTKALACTAIVSIPVIHYHGTILYLDIPVVVVTFIILMNMSQWLTTPIRRFRTHPVWWCFIVIAFLKETTLPILVILFGVRFVFRLGHHVRRGRLDAIPELVRGECSLAVTAIVPILIYLAVRYVFQARPYSGAATNLLDIRLWLSGLSMLWPHAGVTAIFALVGFVVLVASGRRRKAAVSIVLLIGMKAFFLAEGWEYHRVARFDLYVLPSIIYLTWELLTCVVHKSIAVGNLILVGVMALNLATSPVTMDGERQDWVGSDEEWYPYRECMKDIRDVNPKARILLANMGIGYSISLVCIQLKWNTKVDQIKRLPETNVLENVMASLSFASARDYDVIVYRNPGNAVKIPDYHIVNGYLKSAEYKSRSGSLLVFCRPDLQR